MSAPDLQAALADQLGTAVSDLVRLSGGASRETWSLSAGGAPLILQRRRPGAADLSGAVDLEVDLLRAAARAGVYVPRVLDSGDGDGDGDGDGFGGPWMICERLGGEALPKRLLHDDAYAAARPDMARQCGAAAAGIHAIDTAPFEGRLGHDEPIAQLRSILDAYESPSAAFELGFRWLELHPAPQRPTTVVHGDFRTGNLLMDRDGLAGVLDWELAHLGNPVEDLGWFCVRAWRFGSDQRAGGFGPVEQLLDGYRSESGLDVGVDELTWWELLGTLRWGVICVVQAQSHLSGASRSVELATIGRRVSENEWDTLRLLEELS